MCVIQWNVGKMKEVSVFICGVQKGGTTSLFSHLCDHHEMQAPKRKEIHFFDDEKQNWLSPDYGVLDAWFDTPDEFRLKFDVTPIYSFWKPSMKRIRDYNPDAKIICLFRDPIERAWSHWCMEYARQADTLLFADAIRHGRARLLNIHQLDNQWRVVSYVERGFYANQVRRLYDYFSKSQLLFLQSSDLKDHHQATLAQISSFLNISDFAETKPKYENVKASINYPSSLTVDDKHYLRDIFYDDLIEFSELTQVSTSSWLTCRI